MIKVNFQEKIILSYNVKTMQLNIHVVEITLPPVEESEKDESA